MTEKYFQELVNLYLDKEITPSQLNKLANSLRSSETRCSYFHSLCQIHSAETLFSVKQKAQNPLNSFSQWSNEALEKAFLKRCRPLYIFAAVLVLSILGFHLTVLLDGDSGARLDDEMAAQLVRPQATENTAITSLSEDQIAISSPKGICGSMLADVIPDRRTLEPQPAIAEAAQKVSISHETFPRCVLLESSEEAEHAFDTIESSVPDSSAHVYPVNLLLD